MARIWLDATVDDSGLGSSWRRPPVPPIPEVRESLDIPSHSAAFFTGPDEPRTPTISQRRRRTMPPPLKTTNARPRRGAAGRRSHAGPDVISSLVDSLSTISSPANDHFDAIPSLSDAQSQAQPPGLRRIRSDDSGLRSGEHLFAGFDQTHPSAVDDAAIPPVIKTAPPPSGFSALTAPKLQKTPKESPVRAYFKSASKTSLNSQRSSELAAPSMDSVVPSRATSPTDAAFPPDISRTNRHKSLSQPASHERLKQQAAEVKRATINLGEDPRYLSPQKTRQKLQFPRRKHAFDPPQQGPIVEEAHPENAPGAKAASKQRAERAGISIDGSPSVPQRQSSLLHTDGSSYAASSKASSRRRSGKSDTTSDRADLQKPAKGSGAMSRMRKKDSLKFEDVQDIDSEVVKRIKELKARKELREREAQEQPQAGAPVRRTISVARHARSASDPQSPTLGEDVQAPVAHKHFTLGTIIQRHASETDLSGAAGHPTGVDAATRSQEARPTTPSTPFINMEPLPINYTYVMQNLEEPQSQVQSKSGGVAARAESAAVRDRPKSFSLTSRRSGASKKKAAATVTESSSETNSNAGSGRDAVQGRGHSEELAAGRDPDQNSLDYVLSRSTSKKQRWSHPAPEGALHEKPKGRSNKEKVDSFAVKAAGPPASLIEERPSTSHSVDSVDEDVKAFIHAPRLTQKIRHPETGRTIAFSEVGDPKGYAVFCCVGMGLTRYITAFYDELATTLKLRLITPDRPGVGESQSDPNGTPLSWPDDVIAICQALRIKTFSVMAHSAGAIYALATALRVPQHIRGKVHLLAPWIPPSQIEQVGLHSASPPTTQLPKAQRFLRVLPTPFLRVANSSFMTATSASLSPKAGATATPPNRRKRVPPKPADGSPALGRSSTSANPSRPSNQHARRESMMLMDQTMPNGSALSLSLNSSRSHLDPQLVAASTLAEEERRREYDAHLTLRIWDRATTNANPAVDLLVCLERTQPIGFRYVDINRAVVIHHGSKDSRVPVENVKWLGKTMRRCEVRVLEGEGHGLMASAGVMGSVLTEMAAEWEEWIRYTAAKKVEKQIRRGDQGIGGSMGAGRGTSPAVLAA